jgi:transcriptional regulator
MPDFDWRLSETYDRTKVLESTGLAWECLRRNPDYHRDQRALA